MSCGGKKESANKRQIKIGATFWIYNRALLLKAAYPRRPLFSFARCMIVLSKGLAASYTHTGPRERRPLEKHDPEPLFNPLMAVPFDFG